MSLPFSHGYFLFVFCVSVWVRMCLDDLVFVSVHVCVYACVWKSEDNIHCQSSDSICLDFFFLRYNLSVARTHEVGMASRLDLSFFASPLLEL